MMNKFTKLIKQWRVILVVVLLLLSVYGMALSPGQEGASIRAVKQGSAAEGAGIVNPDSTLKPMAHEIIEAVNGEPTLSSTDYFKATEDLIVNETVVIKTDQGTYSLVVRPKIQIITLNETTTITQEIIDPETNETRNETLEVPITETEIIGVEPVGLVVSDAPSSNIKQGLDLQGGTRVIIEPEDEITSDEYDMIKSNLEQRLNVYGLNDVTVSIVNNFQFQPQYIMIEIAGTTVDEIESLVLSQGKFEAIVGNTTVFTGEDGDIAYVGKGPQESRIEQCGENPDGTHFCSFSFQIRLTPSAAARMAAITRSLTVVPSADGGNSYLSQPLELYLDGNNVSSLNIAASLQGRAETSILITGSGSGLNQNEAVEAAQIDMHQLQTVIETGSLPSKLIIVKSDTISPILGQSFLKNAFFVGLIALLMVVVLLSIRYRSVKIVGPIALALVSEVILVLGAYAIFGWTLDLAGIAGIIIVLGTGVDHLVVISDEILKKATSGIAESWKTKIKNAFGIIIGAFLTTAVAMIPLLVVGAGLLRGFAVTTLTGLFVGVVIVRPTFAKVVEVLMN